VLETLIYLLTPALSVAGSLFIINAIIIFHELGHYTASRWCGLMPKSVCVGFGRLIAETKDRHNTKWQLRLWPFGGYVDLCGMSKRAVNKFLALKYGQKVLIMLGGVIANTLLAIFLFWIASNIGYTYRLPIIGKVSSGGVAADKQLKAGDHITMINRKTITTWQDVAVTLLMAKATNTPVNMRIERDGDQIDVPTIDASTPFSGKGKGLFSLGFEPFTPPWPAIITAVEPGSPAAVAGLRVKDKITSINGQTVESADTVLTTLQDNPDTRIEIVVRRNGTLKKYQIMLIQKGNFVARGFLGIRLAPPNDEAQYQGFYQTGLVDGLLSASAEAWQYLLIQAAAFYLLIIGSLSINTLGGPILILSQTYALFSLENIVILLQWTAAINMSLAFINLIPIPIFDGGRIMILSIEAMIGRRLNPHVQDTIDRITMAIILGIAAMITYNDIMRAAGFIQ
jgi:regulator of sigma E protease